MRKNALGIFVCVLLAASGQFLGAFFPIIGGPVLALLLGILLSFFIGEKQVFQPGLTFTSKKILQLAVICLGFGLNISVLIDVGRQSLPIIVSTISLALFLAYLLFTYLPISSKLATLIGVGTSICGGSAIAATAPIIEADEEEVAQAISVIFIFNLLAALLFPSFALWLGFSTDSGQAFGLFAGTAVNDTSSVTAAASTWDGWHALGSQTLDVAVTVKLTRTLAIIPITAALAFYQSKKKVQEGSHGQWWSSFPTFILYFILASMLTTIMTGLGVSSTVFLPMKHLSKFFICMAMAAIGLRTNLVSLVKKGGSAFLIGLICWLGVTILTLVLQAILHIW